MVLGPGSFLVVHRASPSARNRAYPPSTREAKITEARGRDARQPRWSGARPVARAPKRVTSSLIHRGDCPHPLLQHALVFVQKLIQANRTSRRPWPWRHVVEPRALKLFKRPGIKQCQINERRMVGANRCTASD